MGRSKSPKQQEVPAAPGTSLRPRRYSADLLLLRANRWAAARGSQGLTMSTFVELRRDHILPSPVRLKGRPDGRRGAAWGWSALAYRRLLQFLRLRARGLTARRAQRAALFLDGAEIDPEVARQDLMWVFRNNATHLNRKYGTSLWHPGDRMPRPLRKEVASMFDSNQVLEFLRSPGAQLDPGVADDLKGLISDPSFQQAARLAVENMLWVRDPELKKNLDRASGRLPAPIHKAIGADLADTLEVMAGMLSPDENSAVEALEQLSAADVSAVRDYMRVARHGARHGAPSRTIARRRRGSSRLAPHVADFPNILADEIRDALHDVRTVRSPRSDQTAVSHRVPRHADVSTGSRFD